MNIVKQNIIAQLLLIVTVFLLFCCEKKNEDKIYEMDKKYLSESQLFALHQAIENDPDNSEHYFKRAKIYFEREDFNKALKDINQSLKLKEGEGKYYFLQAEIFYKLKDYSSAIKSAKTAEAYKLKDAEVKIILAKSYLANKDQAEAQKYIEEAIAFTPYHSDVFYLKGKIFAESGDTSSALANYFGALKADTNNLDVYKELSSIYYLRNKMDSAWVFLSAGRSINPDDAYFYALEGKFLERYNLKEAAKNFYQTSIKYDSGSVDAYNRLAMIYYLDGDSVNAEKYFQKELKYSPYSLKSNLLLAGIYEKQNRAQLTIPLFEKILKIDSANKEVKKKLDKLYVLYPPVKKDTVIIQSPAQSKLADTSRKVVPGPPDTATRRPSLKPSAKKLNNTKDSSKEMRNFVPLITNPDSTKIEVKPDSIK
ncbi:MAG: tetratricopeptide repeat protein [Cytophagaceae bacterium]|nr:tetratricopeptide repeat protein [Cytophagaceae bacterium]